MSITARLVNNPLIQARVTPQDRVLVTNYQINAATLRIADIFDVDATSVTDGAFWYIEPIHLTGLLPLIWIT
jgi:hypothetical protein